MFEQVTMPAQHRVRADQQPNPAQRRTGQWHEQRGQERPVRWPQSRALTSQLSLQDTRLMAQGEDLDVLVVVGHR